MEILGLDSDQPADPVPAPVAPVVSNSKTSGPKVVRQIKKLPNQKGVNNVLQ